MKTKVKITETIKSNIELQKGNILFTGEVSVVPLEGDKIRLKDKVYIVKTRALEIEDDKWNIIVMEM